MPWQPTTPSPAPTHPFGDLDLQVGALRDDHGSTVGHLLIETDVWWPRTGKLWWRNFTPTPTFSVEFWEDIDGDVEDYFFHDIHEAEQQLRRLRAGTWMLLHDGPNTTMDIAWLPRSSADRVARDAFGFDLPAMRAEH